MNTQARLSAADAAISAGTVQAPGAGATASPGKTDYFVLFSTTVSNWAGKPITFALAVMGILLWAILGPILNYSESWQLVVNTATTIITFLMIFVLQNSQNRDAKALQVKLDELILSNVGAENCFIGAEALSEPELLRLREMVDQKLKAVDDDSEVDERLDALEEAEEQRSIAAETDATSGETPAMVR